jgi:uncharacterized protein (DUF488 family)
MQPVFTIGYGNRPMGEFLTLLSQNCIKYLIDVRSEPRSRYRPEFTADALKDKLREVGIEYVPMGRSLGGRPDDPTCYQNGHVVYAFLRDRAFYRTGIRRIQRALAQQLRVCLMCAEGKPEDCHRSKLIGATLSELGIEVVHIGVAGELYSHADVMTRIEPTQPSLFGDQLVSRRAYRVGGSPAVRD